MGKPATTIFSPAASPSERPDARCSQRAPWILVLALAMLAGCTKPYFRPRGPSSSAAVLIVRGLAQVDHDEVKLRAFRLPERESPGLEQVTPRGALQLEARLAPGRYLLQLDYLKAGVSALSSSTCPQPAEFDLQVGENVVTIPLCDAAGQPLPPTEASCQADGPEPLGQRVLRRLTRAEYQKTVESLAGVDTDVTADFPKEVKSHGFDNLSDLLVVTDAHAEAYLTAAGKVAAKVAAALDRHVTCQDGESEEDCASRFIRSFGPKTFRGVVSDDEHARLLVVFKQGREASATLAGAIELVVQAMLMSPRFLYRHELGVAAGDHFALTSWEIASALSYLYWGTMPDERLFSLAESGELAKPEVIAAEARRLFEDPRGRELTDRFAASWLGADLVLGLNKDQELYPDFTSSLREKLLQETKSFFTEAVLARNATFADLFTAPHTVGDPELAKHYGVGEASLPATLPAEQRLGLLGHASLLASYADANATSPIKRGAFVLERLFCQTLPPPPPGLDIKPPPRDPAATTRERFAAHSQSPACSGCHVRIDGAGFGMEDLDAVGRFQTEQAGKPVDATGRLVGIDGADRDFRGSAELSRLVAGSPTARQCLVTQLSRFSTGTLGAPAACAAGGLQAAFSAGNYNLKQLFLAIPTQSAFVKRRGE